MTPASTHAATSRAGGALRFRLAEHGVGFDDLRFASETHTLLAPAGGTGCVELFDSATLERRALREISRPRRFGGGHDEGTTSADAGAGLVFAIDRDNSSLKVADASALRVLTTVALSGEPDYVRWVEGRREVWVTEPDREQLEIFALAAGPTPKLTRVAALSLADAPESLVIDAARGWAFTQRWAGRTLAIDLTTRAIGAEVANQCASSRGIALDSGRGLLFVGCAEGKVVVLDVDHAGQVLATASLPQGVDIIALSRELRHLYVPAASDGSVTVFGYGERGDLKRLGSWQAAAGAHCVESDDRGHVWVCAPAEGSLLLFDDTFAKGAEP